MTVDENILKGKKHLHFIGIGGSGMFPMVQILHNEGFYITGSDNNETETTKKEMALMSELYKKHYFTINHGDYYRLISPYEAQPVTVSRITAWEFVSKDKNKALFSMVQMDNVNDGGDLYVKLKGLDPEKIYEVQSTGNTYSGAYLMNAGLNFVGFEGDYNSLKVHFKAID